LRGKQHTLTLYLLALGDVDQRRHSADLLTLVVVQLPGRNLDGYNRAILALIINRQWLKTAGTFTKLLARQHARTELRR
jgi:hypothetical protein